MTHSIKTMCVERITVEDGRVLLYGSDPRYHVIGGIEALKVEIGDEIEYEPYGYNFGWLKETK